MHFYSLVGPGGAGVCASGAFPSISEKLTCSEYLFDLTGAISLCSS